MYAYKTRAEWLDATCPWSMLAYSGLSSRKLRELAMACACYGSPAVVVPGNRKIAEATLTACRHVMAEDGHSSMAQLRRLATQCHEVFLKNDTGLADHAALAIQHAAKEICVPTGYGENAAYAAKHAASRLTLPRIPTLIRTMVSWDEIQEGQKRRKV